MKDSRAWEKNTDLHGMNAMVQSSSEYFKQYVVYGAEAKNIFGDIKPAPAVSDALPKVSQW